MLVLVVFTFFAFFIGLYFGVRRGVRAGKAYSEEVFGLYLTMLIKEGKVSKDVLLAGFEKTQGLLAVKTRK